MSNLWSVRRATVVTAGLALASVGMISCALDDGDLGEVDDETTSVQAAAVTPTLRFAGGDWIIKAGTGMGPGPNTWDPANAWVDSSGALHLKLSYVNGEWRCAQVISKTNYGFGSYQFQVIGPIDKLDKNVVLGLFDYPAFGVAPDGTNEIDIEFARWGSATNPNGNWTVYPTQLGTPPTTHKFNFALNGSYTTHRFTRTATSVSYESLHGHVDGPGSQIASWTFAPSQPSLLVPQRALPVLFNLWLFQGRPPSDGKPVEIIIKSFKFRTP
ncbi:MAG: glycoside hydrolase family 16 protein [Kofleriaceae bacterium]